MTTLNHLPTSIPLDGYNQTRALSKQSASLESPEPPSASTPAKDTSSAVCISQILSKRAIPYIAHDHTGQLILEIAEEAKHTVPSGHVLSYLTQDTGQPSTSLWKHAYAIEPIIVKGPAFISLAPKKCPSFAHRVKVALTRPEGNNALSFFLYAIYLPLGVTLLMHAILRNWSAEEPTPFFTLHVMLTLAIVVMTSVVLMPSPMQQRFISPASLPPSSKTPAHQPR